MMRTGCGAAGVGRWSTACPTCPCVYAIRFVLVINPCEAIGTVFSPSSLSSLSVVLWLYFVVVYDGSCWLWCFGVGSCSVGGRGLFCVRTCAVLEVGFYV